MSLSLCRRSSKQTHSLACKNPKTQHIFPFFLIDGIRRAEKLTNPKPKCRNRPRTLNSTQPTHIHAHVNSPHVRSNCRPSTVRRSSRHVRVSVAQDGLLSSQTAASLRQVLAAKVAGLTRLTAGGGCGGMKAVLAFSSIAGVLGSAGQGSYAAANSAVDVWTAVSSSQVQESHYVMLSIMSSRSTSSM